MVAFGLGVGIAAIFTIMDASLIESAIDKIINNVLCVDRAEDMLIATRWSAVSEK